MKDLIKSKYLTRENAKKLGKLAGHHSVSAGVGAGKTMKDLGLSLMEGASYVARKSGADVVANEIDAQRGRSQGAWDDNGIEKRAHTKMGWVGQVAAASVPAIKPAKIGGAVAKMAQAVRKMKKFPKAMREARRLDNSARGVKAAQTYRNSLPKTADTIEYPSKPIYPSRTKYNTIEEYMKNKKK